MAERREVFDRIRRGEINKSAASKLLGISRTRITQLMKREAVQAAKPAAAPVPAGPRIVQPDPAPAPTKKPEQPAGIPSADPAPAGPVDLKAVLDPVAPAAPAVTVGPIPVDGEGKPIDPDDAEAGRELLGWIRRGAAEFIAKVIYKAKADDARLEKLKEENKFLKVALKRNSDKAAPLGWFTRGWVGLVVGFGIEFIRVATTFPPAAGAKPAATPPKPVEDAPSAPPITTVEQVRDDVEGRPRPTVDERIRMSQGG
jgi:hypothetical protein